MTMKVVFERETLRLLGAQIVGVDGVDKRIDVLATAIQAGIRADKLKDLDLAYAPPYSSAKDPVNMAGFMIENVDSGILKQWHWEQEPDLPRDGSVQLLDVRTVGEYGRGHIDGFMNIPIDDLRARLGGLTWQSLFMLFAKVVFAATSLVAFSLSTVLTAITSRAVIVSLLL